MRRNVKLSNLAGGVFICICILVLIIIIVHLSYEQRESERAVIYLKARQQAVVDKQKRLIEYEKRHRETELSRQYRKGRVVGAAPAAQHAGH